MEPGLRITFTLIVTFAVIFTTSSAFALNRAQSFLNSLAAQAHVQSTRLHKTGEMILASPPALVVQWGLIEMEAAAYYNGSLNTVVVTPEMLTTDSATNSYRLKSVPELYRTDASPRTAATVLFHELSHAEWDFFIEERKTPEDIELLNVMLRESVKIARANQMSVFSAEIIASEIFAYYRGELLDNILVDADRFYQDAGLNPFVETCSSIRSHNEKTLRLEDNITPYLERTRIRIVYATREEVVLDKAPESAKRIHAALVRHTQATLQFPKSSYELSRQMMADTRIQHAIKVCNLIK